MVDDSVAFVGEIVEWLGDVVAFVGEIVEWLGDVVALADEIVEGGRRFRRAWG
ncbi:MAG: hypothetical protein IPM54_20310 [Polyangiaceae bacterium]|nr:hypothetical protein [Polyangiaceae bacterium]